jgi:hypothetical protein
MQFIVLEQGFEGVRLNTGTMSDLQTLAATLLANFTTVRIPRCESLWISSVPNPSPKHRHRMLSRALAGENLIISCHRQHLQYRLLEQGHRAFFDRIEGGGPAGWRPHFFCRDPAAISVLYDVVVGVCGLGNAVTFDPEQFVMHRLGRLERTGPSEYAGWMVGLGLVKRSTMSSYSSKLYPDCADSLLVRIRICDSIWH